MMPLKLALPLMLSLAFMSAAALAQSASPAGQTASDSERISQALAGLHPQRPGVVDAYVIVIALDTDLVFGREAREAGRVLASRFDAQGRTIVLGEDEGDDRAGAAGTPNHLEKALGRAAALMDRKEDVLILYTTSHGTPRAGLNYRDVVRGSGVITPTQLSAMLTTHGFQNRLVILQACFSGQFIPALGGPRAVVATASSATRSSFGCASGNDWTFFGYALVNQAMRKPDTFVRQFRRAFVTIYGWETKLRMQTSNPEINIGSEASEWLNALDARAPKVETQSVGRPPSELGQ